MVQEEEGGLVVDTRRAGQEVGAAYLEQVLVEACLGLAGAGAGAGAGERPGVPNTD